MINKKLLAAATLIAAVSASPVLAKTEGNYFGFNIIKTDTDVNYNGGGGATFTDDQISFGLDIRHAFNFDRLFITPGAFVEYNAVEAADGSGGFVETNKRVGGKVDIGYDITDQFAAYFTNGLAFVDYDVNWAIGKESDTELGYFYGAGIAFTINPEFSVNLEYNVQNVDYDTPSSAVEADTDISVMKLGISYHF